jgi:hypothetical protein
VALKPLSLKHSFEASADCMLLYKDIIIHNQDLKSVTFLLSSAYRSWGISDWVYLNV